VEVAHILGKGFLKGITLQHLRALVALSDLKLVARVSEALGMTQPAVSKHIAELGRIVGVPIVMRDRNRLYLTPIDSRLAEHARQALSETIGFSAKRTTGTLTDL
jgi:DNA-binding transcriptional LysR family regulator